MRRTSSKTIKFIWKQFNRSVLRPTFSSSFFWARRHYPLQICCLFYVSPPPFEPLLYHSPDPLFPSFASPAVCFEVNFITFFSLATAFEQDCILLTSSSSFLAFFCLLLQHRCLCRSAAPQVELHLKTVPQLHLPLLPQDQVAADHLLLPEHGLAQKELLRKLDEDILRVKTNRPTYVSLIHKAGVVVLLDSEVKSWWDVGHGDSALLAR